MAVLILEIQTGDERSTLEFSQDEIIIGRGSGETAPDVVLNDTSASRKHARIWRALDGYWIEDLCSMHGTTKKGVPLMGPSRIFSGDFFEMGDSLLTIEKADITEPDADLDGLFDVHLSDGFGVGDRQDAVNPAAQIRVVAHEEVFTPQTGNAAGEQAGESRNWNWHDDEKLRLATQANPSLVFGHLTENFANEESLEYSTELAIKDIVNVIAPAERGAVLLFNADHTQLELCAHYPAFKPAFSTTLALNALTTGRAFVWKTDSGDITSTSIKRLNIKCGLYAPVAFGLNQLGVACVDSTNVKAEFTHEELALFINISQVLGALVHGKQARLATNAL